MSSHLTVFSDPDERRFRAAAGHRIGDPLFELKYSAMTPITEEESVHRWLSALWRPFWVLGGDQDLAWHYTHDMCGPRRSAWISGYCFDGARGRSPAQEELRSAMWKAALEHLEDKWGYRSLFSYTLASASGAIRWNEVACGYTRVGTLNNAAPTTDGDRMPIVVFTWRPQDEALCRAQIKKQFPEGVWESRD